MLSLMDHHCWLAYVLDLFAKLPMLNTFFCIMRTDELFRCATVQPPPSWCVLHRVPALKLPGIRLNGWRKQAPLPCACQLCAQH